MKGSRLRCSARFSRVRMETKRVLRLPMWRALLVPAAVGPAMAVLGFVVLASLITTPLSAAMPQESVQAQAVVETEVYTQLAQNADKRAYVIVLLRAPRTNGGMETKKTAVKQVQERVLAKLAADEFAIAYKYEMVAAVTGRVNASGLAKLAADPDVASIGPDGFGEAQLNDSVPFINADDVQALGYTGAGITVAVLDTGIDSNHPNLSDDIAAGWYHFLDQGMTVGPGAEDDNGHGTNVSGIITSKGVAPCSIGVAPDADILAIKVLKSDASGWVSDWVAGVDYVVANVGNYAKLPVINMSLGTWDLYTACPCDNATTYNQLMQAALQRAKNAGIVTFASSGNQGYCDRMSAPACLSAATAVAAVYDQNLGREPDSGTYQSVFGSPWPACYDATTAGDKIACFSNRSRCNSLAGPGRLITAPGLGGGASTYTGTSQASPHAAGVAALMWQKAMANGGWWLTPDWVVGILEWTGASTVDACSGPQPLNPNPRRVDALAAVNRLCPKPGDRVVCEPQGGVNPIHPKTYWYDVTPPDFGRCDFHVRVYDSEPGNYANWSLPAATWQFAVHQVGNDWWASWWDPGCTNAIFATFRFRFDNPNLSMWGDWTTTIGASSDPYTQPIDTSACHANEADGSGYRVHVPAPKWEQLPDLHSTGVDVYAQSPPGPPVVVADDFLCTTTGPITDVDIWGSWYQDALPAGDPSNVTFVLSIHADVPANPPAIPYSRPGGLLCMYTFAPGAFSAEIYAEQLYEGFYNPGGWPGYQQFGDSKCWLYRFHIPDAACIQHGSPGQPVVYWLDVQAFPQAVSYFGWKTTYIENHWNDDAVWTIGAEPAQGPWTELRYPEGHPFMGISMDMAFRIFSRSSPPPDPPTPPPGEPGLNKVRFISFLPGNPGVQTAIRVKLTSLHHASPPYTGGPSVPFIGFEGQGQYVGPPAQYVESASSGTPFYASQLQCMPEYRDWSTVGLLHVTGEAIMPSSTYQVENLAASCAGNEASCPAVSAALEVKTTRWGDVETPYNPPATDPQPDTSDISALVNKFKSAPGAPIKARALLFGDSRGRIDIAPDFSFSHISMCVDAFKGSPYPYKPGKCTGDPTKACATEADCTAQSVAGPCILCP